jgi:hypothetical protein
MWRAACVSARITRPSITALAASTALTTAEARPEPLIVAPFYQIGHFFNSASNGA